jgi:tetratricopeptide (TPR) repeat protein
MLRFFISALVLLCLECFVSAQAPASPQGDAVQAPTFEAAQELAGKGRLDKAMAMLDGLAAQTPEPAGVERLRGIIFYQREQLSQAIEAFTKAEAQDPGDRESIEMHGVSLFRTGHPAEAIPFLERAHAAVERANVDPEYVLGLCYADVARYDDARHAFATQYGFAPDSAEAYLLAGRLFLRREMRDQAAVQASKALELRWRGAICLRPSGNWSRSAKSILCRERPTIAWEMRTCAAGSIPRPSRLSIGPCCWSQARRGRISCLARHF